VTSSASVGRGLDIIGIGSEVTAGHGGPGQSFGLTDSAVTKIWTGCRYRGGEYADTAEGGCLAAGTLTCDGDYTVQRLRSYVSQATTCGGKPASQCGKIGVA
jgi:hypothetical protein